MSTYATTIGVTLGWYEALAGTESMTSAELAAATMAKPSGTVIVMDERVGEHFTGEPDPVEQLMYGFSLICCLPDGRHAPESVATGTVMRPPTLERYATEAGFTTVETLPIDNDFFRFYQLAL